VRLAELRLSQHFERHALPGASFTDQGLTKLSALILERPQTFDAPIEYPDRFQRLVSMGCRSPATCRLSANERGLTAAFLLEARGVGQGKDDHFFAGHGTYVMVHAQHLHASNLVDQRFQHRASDL
jgi:hypothetical protein